MSEPKPQPPLPQRLYPSGPVGFGTTTVPPWWHVDADLVIYVSNRTKSAELAAAYPIIESVSRPSNVRITFKSRHDATKGEIDKAFDVLKAQMETADPAIEVVSYRVTRIKKRHQFGINFG